MAKYGAAEAEQAVARKSGELKRELRRLVRLIVEEDDGRIDTYDEASRVLSELKDLTFGSPAVPQHFLCPISSELMKDPVILASGQTYDRAFIQEWLNSGNRICPQTRQVLPNTILTPNHLVRSMISEWCIEHDIPLPALESQDEGLITRKERSALHELLEKISSSSIHGQKQAMKELRLLTKNNRSFRALIGEQPDIIPLLLSVLSVSGLNDDPVVQEDTVTTILNLSIHESNKRIVGDDPEAIPFLIDALKNGTMETRSNAAAALFTLSALDSNKLKIGELGAIRPLLELLEQGSTTAKKDAASAIFNICMPHENRAKAVKEGAVGVVLKAIRDPSLADGSLAILALLSGDQDALEEIGKSGGVPCLLGIIRESTCERNKENAVVVLFAVCMYDRTNRREVREDEKLNGSISALAQTGTRRARRKADGILDMLKRLGHNTHYSC
ncbi:U-box domain-containing protein 9-like [Elaeis guineensis]|uniref:RING-type E3 ubiquitin transferase n=1 Tax=Elaeis guineensis var. tenera TaxID=51953 RepID=A0A6I9QGM9_ELAGV|nr:U-box domain-containing protein 9 [Elaeis guineensis]